MKINFIALPESLSSKGFQLSNLWAPGPKTDKTMGFLTSCCLWGENHNCLSFSSNNSGVTITHSGWYYSGCIGSLKWRL
jgi:hypothetical protein